MTDADPSSRPPPGRAAGPAAAGGGARARAKILVVDDLPEKHLVYRTILDDPGYDVLAARSGSEALKLLLEHEFAAILLDINMPGMDGFETAAIIRSRKRCAHVPILFVTAHADELLTIRGYAEGAVDYMLAPVDPQVLRTKVGVFVELHRRANRLLAESETRASVAEGQREHLAAMLEATTDWVLRFDEQGAVLWSNRAARAVLGLAENRVATIGDFHSEAALKLLWDTALPAARTQGTWAGESSMRARDGSELPISQVILAHRGVGGRIESFSIIARDLSDRMRIEAELRRHRQELARLVDERTAELRTSYERLRLAERMAAIGTLAAGISHDLGNLLLPVRLRIDAMVKRKLDAEMLADLTAIRKSAEYLQRLNNGLRMLTQNPGAPGHEEHFPMRAWWEDAEPLLKNAVPRGIVLEADLPADLPELRVTRTAFAQAMFNLVQNSGDALRSRGKGRIEITARALTDGSRLAITVKDDGVGMTAEVRRRCLEPFFSTKTRGFSTGLGLALVHGLMQQAGGSIDIESEPERGTTVVLTLKAWTEDLASAQQPQAAAITLGDARLRAYAAAVLRGLRFETRAGEPDGKARLWLGDAATVTAEPLRAFLNGSADRIAVVVGGPAPLQDERVFVVENARPATLRDVLARAVIRGTGDGASNHVRTGAPAPPPPAASPPPAARSARARLTEKGP